MRKLVLYQTIFSVMTVVIFFLFSFFISAIWAARIVSCTSVLFLLSLFFVQEKILAIITTLMNIAILSGVMGITGLSWGEKALEFSDESVFFLFFAACFGLFAETLTDYYREKRKMHSEIMEITFVYHTFLIGLPLLIKLL